MALGVATFFFPRYRIPHFPAGCGAFRCRPFKTAGMGGGLVGMLAPCLFYGAWIFLTGQWESFQTPCRQYVPREDSIKQAGVIYPLRSSLLAVVIGSVFIITIDQPAPCSIPEMLEPRLPLPAGKALTMLS